LTDEAGVVTDTYTYDAFGILINRTGTSDNAYLYCGEQWDADLGLYCLRARYMNPNSGRFWTMDKYEGGEADTNCLHKYLYANADPVRFIDPTGKFGLAEAMMTVAVIGLTDAMAFPAIQVRAKPIFRLLTSSDEKDGGAVAAKVQTRYQQWISAESKQIASLKDIKDFSKGAGGVMIVVHRQYSYVDDSGAGRWTNYLIMDPESYRGTPQELVDRGIYLGTVTIAQMDAIVGDIRASGILCDDFYCGKDSIDGVYRMEDEYNHDRQEMLRDAYDMGWRLAMKAASKH
jgi:RHS repeat-associated protein